MKQVSGCCSWEQPGACRRRQGELKDHNAVLLVASLHFSSVALGGVWGCCHYRWVTQAVPRYSCDPVPPSPVAYISLKSIRSGEKRSIQSFNVLEVSGDADFLGWSQAGSRRHFNSPVMHPAPPLKSQHPLAVCAVPDVLGRNGGFLLLIPPQWSDCVKAVLWDGDPATAACHHPQALLKAGGTPAGSTPLLREHVLVFGWRLSYFGFCVLFFFFGFDKVQLQDENICFFPLKQLISVLFYNIN